MTVIIFTPASYQSDTSQAVATTATEIPYILTLNEQHIEQKSIPLPYDCNTNLIITLSLNGIALPQGEFWVIVEQHAPVQDFISWQGLKLQEFARVGDSVIISYYKKS